MLGELSERLQQRSNAARRPTARVCGTTFCRAKRQVVRARHWLVLLFACTRCGSFATCRFYTPFILTLRRFLYHRRVNDRVDDDVFAAFPFAYATTMASSMLEGRMEAPAPGSIGPSDGADLSQKFESFGVANECASYSVGFISAFLSGQPSPSMPSRLLTGLKRRTAAGRPDQREGPLSRPVRTRYHGGGHATTWYVKCVGKLAAVAACDPQTPRPCSYLSSGDASACGCACARGPALRRALTQVFFLANVYYSMYVWLCVCLWFVYCIVPTCSSELQGTCSSATTATRT